jgi:MarR family transcriptional regulator, 2-MHQ and catechol-resistance regulon repressor
MSNLDTELALDETIELFWETIPPSWRCIRKKIHGVASESFGITVEQFHILRHIRKGKGSVSELADEKQISRSAISQAVDILVEKGLIQRSQSPDDRRWVHLELTPDGDELLNAIFKETHRWMKTKMDSLSPDDLEVMRRAMLLFKNTFLPACKTE